MIRLRARLSISLLALVFASCVEPQVPAAIPSEAAAPEKPAFKKQPRMHDRGRISSLSLEEFFTLHQSGKALVFDARPGFFYSLGHIEGAIHLPKTNCDEQIHQRDAEIKAALAAGKTLVVYCSGPGCPDARTVATHLSGFGHPVSIFSGGWDAWKKADLPAE